VNSSRALLSILISLLGWNSASGFPRAEGTAPYSGTWTASVGDSRILRGRWIGEAIPQDPSSAHGSWTLAGPSGKAALTGTWTAHKTRKGWEGAWSANTEAGRAASGTWKADLPANSKATLQDFLELLLNQSISGTWRSGGLSGGWRLENKPRPSGQ
jgi:hypothetical protein